MKLKTVKLATFALIGGIFIVAQEASACSFLKRSMLEKYTTNSKIFLGTVLDQSPQCSPNCKDTYVIHIDEAFKFPTKQDLGLTGQLPENEQTIEVPFSINEQCGFSPLKAGGKVFVFMNDGDVVSHPSGSWFIWPENKQTTASINPVMDDVLLLRQMLNRVPVPDADTAIHLAFKAMIPIFGQDAVTKNMPYKASLVEGKYVPHWRVEGTAVQCAQKSGTEDLPCRAGVLSAEINEYSGDVEHVFSGD